MAAMMYLSGSHYVIRQSTDDFYIMISCKVFHMICIQELMQAVYYTQ